jgi:hypothetical protein
MTAWRDTLRLLFLNSQNNLPFTKHEHLWQEDKHTAPTKCIILFHKEIHVLFPLFNIILAFTEVNGKYTFKYKNPVNKPIKDLLPKH